MTTRIRHPHSPARMLARTFVLAALIVACGGNGNSAPAASSDYEVISKSTRLDGTNKYYQVWSIRYRVGGQTEEITKPVVIGNTWTCYTDAVIGEVLPPSCR